MQLATGAGLGFSKVNIAYRKVNPASISGAFYFQKSKYSLHKSAFWMGEWKFVEFWIFCVEGGCIGFIQYEFTDKGGVWEKEISTIGSSTYP